LKDVYNTIDKKINTLIDIFLFEMQVSKQIRHAIQYCLLVDIIY